MSLTWLKGVLAGIVYNGLRPLDMAHDKEERTKIRWVVRREVEDLTTIFIRGSVRTLSSIPYDYKEQNPGLFQVWFGLLKDEILDYYRISWLRILWLCFVHWFNWSICFNVFGCLNLCSLLNYLFDSSVNATHYWIAKNKLFGSIDWIEPG